jgi:hypothetical protein
MNLVIGGTGMERLQKRSSDPKKGEYFVKAKICTKVR